MILWLVKQKKVNWAKGSVLIQKLILGHRRSSLLIVWLSVITGCPVSVKLCNYWAEEISLLSPASAIFSEPIK
jgi:hypothetical protein